MASEKEALYRRFNLFFKGLFILSTFSCLLSWVYKDRLPNPSYYRSVLPIDPPIQQRTEQPPFDVFTKGQHYWVIPKFEYELTGVIVSETKAGEFGDIWHYKRWKDFINIRDLCVLWGDNVAKGAYTDMWFKSDTWTCWAYNHGKSAAGQPFNSMELSNNHLLATDYLVKKRLMTAEVGDVIQIKGWLTDYRNVKNGYYRKTSTVRTDGGNGACETVFINQVTIIKKANPLIRGIFQLSLYMSLFSLVVLFILIFIAPLKKMH